MYIGEAIRAYRMEKIKDYIFSLGEIKMNEIHHALLIINELKEEWYTQPSSYKINKKYFELLSYQRWVINEIKIELLNHQKEHPIDILEKMLYNFDKHSCETTSEDVNYIFSIACDVIRDVLDVFKASL